MADLSFSQAPRRSLLVPILLSVFVLALAGYLIWRFTPHRTADLSVTATTVFPVHLVFKGDTIVVGRDQVEDDVYVLVTVRLKNELRLPLFLKDFNGSLIPSDTLPLTTSAVQKADLATLYQTFPALEKLAAKQANPLYRETRVDPGQTVEGTVMLHFPVTPAVWDARQDATLTIDLYHQPSLTLTIPKTSVTAPPASAKRAS